jgi:hypothetical protein
LRNSQFGKNEERVFGNEEDKSFSSAAFVASSQGRETRDFAFRKPRKNDDGICVANVIPFKRRNLHLATFLPVMERTFQSLPCWKVFIVEQDDSFEFNRGMLLNVEVVEALFVKDSSISSNCSVVSPI